MTRQRTLPVLRLGTVTLAVAALVTLRASTQTLFRGSADYVTINVVVTDRRDRPVQDLVQTDFSVFDNGRPQTVEYFAKVATPLPRASPARSDPSRRVIGRDGLDTPTPRRVVALLVDDFHLTESEIVTVKRWLVEIIGNLQPDDVGALIFAGRSDLGRDATVDHASLLSAVDDVRKALGFGLDSSGRSGVASVGDAADKRIQLDYAERSDRAIEAVVARLADSPFSRRIVVWISGGSVLPTVPIPTAPPTPTDYSFLQDLYVAAQRANVEVYTVDPRLNAMPEDTVRGGIGSFGGLGGPSGSAARAAAAENLRRQADRLFEIARNTGGRAFTRQSSITSAVERMFVEFGNYYVLGYRPDAYEPNGKYHKLVVKVARRDVRTRARDGYVALRR